MPVKPVRTEPPWDQCLYSEYNKQVFIHVILTKISYNVKLSLYRILVYYQRGNQNPYIEEEQTTQWPKEKVQKDKQ
jgi:hypothetical protein